MIGEPSAVTERRDYVCRTDSQQFPLSKPICLAILFLIDSPELPIDCKRKESARGNSAVCWPLIAFVEAVQDEVPIKAYRSVPPRYNQSEVATAIQNKNVRSPVKHPASEG